MTEALWRRYTGNVTVTANLARAAGKPSFRRRHLRELKERKSQPCTELDSLEVRRENSRPRQRKSQDPTWAELCVFLASVLKDDAVCSHASLVLGTHHT